MTGHIIVNGREHDVLARWPAKDPEVRLWTKTGLALSARAKRASTRAIWVHWTGGENDAAGVLGTLKASRTSCNFYVDQTGLIWQYADAAMATAHAGGPNVVLSANPWACSIEIANRATDEGDHKKWPREVIEDELNEQRFKVTRFYDAQTVSVIALVETLCGAFGIPMDVPRDEHGKLLARTLTIDELRTFTGVAGHYHNHLTKRDPGTEILRAIADHPLHHRDWNAE